MSKKRVAEKRTLSDISIVDIAEEGKGVGKAGELVLFVDKAIPGDVVEVELTRKKKSFAEARISRLIQPSPLRTSPFCKHFGICGGCKWQHMDYPAQLTYKQKSGDNALSSIGVGSDQTIEPILLTSVVLYYHNIQ